MVINDESIKSQNKEKEMQNESTDCSNIHVDNDP